MVTCLYPNCPAAARWHDKLCEQHAKAVPMYLQNRVYRASGTFLSARRRAAIETGAQRYRAALLCAVEAVGGRG